jgi:hypothetical protein
MRRRWAILIVTSIFLVSFGGAALVIWQAKVHQVPLFYVIGGMAMVLGTGFTIMNASVSDDYLRQQFGGEENAARMRQTWRGGWVGILVGAAMIAAEYFLGLGR